MVTISLQRLQVQQLVPPRLSRDRCREDKRWQDVYKSMASPSRQFLAKKCHADDCRFVCVSTAHVGDFSNNRVMVY